MASALKGALRATRTVVSTSAKPRSAASAASAASSAGCSRQLVTCAWLAGVRRTRILASPIIISSTFMWRMMSHSLAGVQPPAKPAHVGCGDVDVDQHAREVERGRCHRFLGHVQVEAVVGDEEVEGVELGARLAVHLDHAAVLDAQAGLRVVGAVGDDQPGFGPRLDKGLFVDVALGEQGEAAGTGRARFGHDGPSLPRRDHPLHFCILCLSPCSFS